MSVDMVAERFKNLSGIRKTPYDVMQARKDNARYQQSQVASLPPQKPKSSGGLTLEMLLAASK